MIRRCALVVVVALVVGSGVGLAQSNPCTVVGTWIHSHEQNSWLGVVTPGVNATGGQLALDWVVFDPTLEGRFPAVRTTGPKGVWEKVNQREYKYTWVAYGLSAAGLPVYVLRASGIGTLAGCDRFDIGGWLELFVSPFDIWNGTPLLRMPLDEFAMRMPLVVVQ
jgi:hypothetical protein